MIPIVFCQTGRVEEVVFKTLVGYLPIADAIGWAGSGHGVTADSVGLASTRLAYRLI